MRCENGFASIHFELAYRIFRPNRSAEVPDMQKCALEQALNAGEH